MITITAKDLAYMEPQQMLNELEYIRPQIPPSAYNELLNEIREIHKKNPPTTKDYAHDFAVKLTAWCRKWGK